MGDAKQLLDVGGQTMLSAVLKPLSASRVDGIVLVTHSAIAAGLGKEQLRDVFVAINDDETTEMIDSIRIGLSTWRRQTTVRERDGFLVCPGDHPGIGTADFDACVDAYGNNPDRIVIATHNHRRGHPIVFPASFASFVRSEPCDAGLNVLPRANPDRILTVPCSSPAVTGDVDTPEDYRRLH
ncbi:MAG: nucleotidyltransferase family protein [Phycisphaerales bacterium]|nr:MAG: nucleotidyltransferase family protein [Phycisphaerales bacterium]